MPDSKDYSRTSFEEFASGWDKQRPRDIVVVQNQWNVWACTRFGITHVVNGNNILEYSKEWLTYSQIDAMDVWNRGNKSLTLQSALKQMISEWLIEWYVQPKTIEQIKASIDGWYYIYTGSSNCDWWKTKLSKVYVLRTDWKFVWHAYALVWYTDVWWLAINSRWPTRADKWYFTIPFEYTDKLYTKYSIIDKSDNFEQFKVKEKALALQLLNSEFFNLTKNVELQNLLHATNEIIRSGKF
jgi:hypothetical protein